MSWVVRAAAESGEYAEPWRHAPQVWQFFRDEADLLGELQRDWRTTLAGAVYLAIEAGEGDLREDVLTAWSSVERRHGHLRRILEAHRDHPAIASAMRKEQALLSAFLTPQVA